ncbi:MAG: type I-F CRISPR-associated helicase Cas3 [Piscirickettsiaceae bacterium CG_4_9_14_3_um_filter_43_564]|nr:type I-F CRISPR-associated helicase Cas3 [Thiomicrospira sp.]OIP95749.1 MAG: type I-F CRISPR-associated helicase Cas3 [Thiomicrospira sp. CG2_30_44_34]PIQ02823.1 MAG: type I-F CRISPR-associated helicase Cas3 [Piscirickettsiaceae bacterium CG18_big_fil_WC_8_21_14_2_50_44_103]PIW78043.1 MAG: type I-F CRISPR-associated helicase Cas3 [Piscirickettsiaceae bacterium CG_4_8_14_3_um_filter_44_38]PIX78566.1 MAG: type I-F CRISPR-associated helicase Cas3 [Piscirickettsiaceae bacterium CG_4_10_14_3_um_f
MMVTFVSQCEKKALNRTRRVLDAFADRIGDNTWQTVITQEGLLAVKKLLRKTASKNTAVSCHWIRSRSRTELVWVVGNKNKFNEQGVVPVNMTSKLLNTEVCFALNTSVISLLSHLAGLFHDVGKAMALFQEKLKLDFTGTAYEPYRHEWVSLRIFQAFIGGKDDKDWLEALVNIDNAAEDKMLGHLASLRDGIDVNSTNPFKTLPPVAKLVAWLIVSHHKLPQYPKNEDNPPTFENMDKWLSDSFEACWNSPQCLNDDWQKSVIENNWSFEPHGTPLKSAHWQTQVSIVAKKILRCDRMFMRDWFDQHFTAHLARLSLMLSDHYYSSKKETTPEWQDRNYHAYANTDKDEHGKKYRKQKLDEHNIAVGINAYDIAMAIPRLKDELPSLNRNTAFTDAVPRDYQEDFGWQDNAYNLALSIKDDTKRHGFFGVCMASTGKGKTRANTRIMYGLAEEETCRFSVALGLRTLTLQTGDALKENLKLRSDELAVLIGSQAVKDLHQQSRSPEETEQQRLGSESAESLLKDEITLIEDLPVYTGICAEWFKHDPKILKLVQAPVLVSTIDYLMPANEGIRGGRQIAPMLRLLTSDLVLDEPDDFGLEDLPALCRLVNWAGMLGSRVLLSTATISPALAGALFLAYQAGRKHYTQVNGEHGEIAQICCAWFDEFKCPQSALISDSTSYEDMHNSFVNKRIKNLKNKTSPLRKAKLISITSNPDHIPTSWMATVIRQSIETLHQQHAVTVADKKVTIGLVRMANIDPLIQVAKYLLADNAPEDTLIHYCVYHSQFPLLHRSKIEKQLDDALSRHNEKEWLEQSGIKNIVENHVEKNHVFVVLATAVAEVGRDHDYDWAVIEPSSMRSIIQLAGRVQRHRQQVPPSENIHILSKNFKGLKGQAPCFEKPGFESVKFGYASRDLSELLEADEFDVINAIARIQAPNTLSLTKESPPRFKSFNELEHCAQTLRLVGNVNQPNHAAQWWNNEATWCGEIQRLQPFRQSAPNDDFRLTFTRTGKAVWQKKIPKTSPPKFENTTDIARQAEQLVIGLRNVVWGEFKLKDEVAKLVKAISDSEERVLERFTHLSLRKLDENSFEQWQCHPMLGVYRILKKDEYK